MEKCGLGEASKPIILIRDHVKKCKEAQKERERENLDNHNRSRRQKRKLEENQSRGEGGPQKKAKTTGDNDVIVIDGDDDDNEVVFLKKVKSPCATVTFSAAAAPSFQQGLIQVRVNLSFVFAFDLCVFSTD